MSGFIECPHCLTRVLPMADRCCPKCLKNTQAPGTSPFTRVTVTPAVVFPQTCCTCAEPTARREAIVGKGHGADPAWVRILAAVGLGLFFKPAVKMAISGELGGMLGGDPELFRLEVPYCNACVKKSPLYPEHVNPQQGTVDLKVLRLFADELRALNPGRSI